MRTGPLPPALRARALNSASNKSPNTEEIPANTSIALPTEPGRTEPILTTHSSGDQPPCSQVPGGISDNVSDTSAPPELLDLAPSVADYMSVDEETPPTAATPSSVGCDSVIQTTIIPALGVLALVPTSPPALLFVDKDERPNWLLTSINEHLQHVPYYLCLSKVVDLFLTQEARLGYPPKVSKFRLLLFTR